MNFKDIKDLSKKELIKKGSSLKEDLFQAKMKNSLGQLGNPMEIRKIRRDLARVRTAMTSAQKAQ
jgi:large subunit ribosomal protein L29